MLALFLFLAAYAALYGAFGLQSPFLPPLLNERGLQPEDIGLVLAGAMAVRVLAGPIVSHAADRLHQHTLILSGCALLAAAATAAFLLPHSFAGVFGVALLHAAMLGPIRRSWMLWAPRRRRTARAGGDASGMAGSGPPDPGLSR